MRSIILVISILSSSLLASTNFYLGKEKTKWGLKLSSDNPHQYLTIGTRLQSVLRHSSSSSSSEDVDFQDFYLRRVRLQVGANYSKNLRFYADIRNDNSNKADKGEGKFEIGDAYVEVKNLFNNDGLKLKAFRAKVDVSRTETISSSRLITLNRAFIADYAANFINESRRATNIQILGTFDHWSFQTVIGDSVQSDSFDDALGESVDKITNQSLMYGAKFRLFPFDNWEDKKLTETYFGKGQHFSFGLGIFKNDKIEFEYASNQFEEIDRTLLNAELSFHYKGLSFIGEFFKFDGVIEDYSSATLKVGESDGYYGLLEYLHNPMYPSFFIRYESWDRFKDSSDYEQKQFVLGSNWYLKGNNLRVGLEFRQADFDKKIMPTDDLGRSFESNKEIILTSMWHY